jgi:hypothetical protein
MTPQETVPLNPELLEKYSVLRSSPSWKQVEESRRRLESLRQSDGAYDKMEVDRDNVLLYSATMRRSGETIAAALCLAVHLARFSDKTTQAQRIEDGFSALAAGLDLFSLDEVQTRDELVRCASAILPDQRLEFPTMNDPGSWKQSLDAALKTIRDADRPQIDDCRRRSLENWRARLLAHAAGKTEVPPDIDYLRCRTAGVIEGMVLRGRLKSLSVREWSEAYVTGMTLSPYQIPLWFAFGALGGLGFEIARELPGIASKTVENEEWKAAVEFVMQATSTVPRKGVIVVRAATESLTANWRVSPVPALVVTADQFHARHKVELNSYFESRIHGILVEVERNETVEAALRRVDVARVQRPYLTLAIGLIVAQRPATPPAGYRFSVAPQDSVEACNDAFLSVPPPA